MKRPRVHYDGSGEWWYSKEHLLLTALVSLCTGLALAGTWAATFCVVL